jgi:hypothetical protein
VVQASPASWGTMLDGWIDSLIGGGMRNVPRVDPHCLIGCKKGVQKDHKSSFMHQFRSMWRNMNTDMNEEFVTVLGQV